jgi:Protein of unknown function (DUF3108)
MIPFRALRRLGLALLLIPPCWETGPHAAELGSRSYAVRYDISLAFLSIGTARFSELRRGNGYQLHLGATFSGLFRYFFAPHLNVDAMGTEAAGRLLATRYALEVDHPEDPQRVDMTLSAGSVNTILLTPPLPERADRVPVLPEHKKGIADPLTAFLIPSKGGTGAADICAQTLKVFDGAGRFDIALLPDREGHITLPGYDGPTIECQVRYIPVSGHREKRANVTYMENNRDISIRLVPVPGRPYFVPVEISIATLIGTLQIEATAIEGFDVKSESVTAETP